ncbi:MAG: ParB/RepB/Spo0J family partition protein [bacterium]
MTAKPRGGLGRGLSALIPTGLDETGVEIQLTDIEVGRIYVRPDQPRAHFNPEALSELVDSVKAQGILVPLIVTPRDSGGYTLVAGERRLRAARAAELLRVPCRVIEGLDDRAILEISLVENLQREDLNPIELAEGYRRLSEDLGYTQLEVAERVGKDRATVANTMRLLALPEPVLALVVEGKLSAGHARALLAVEGEAERVALAHRIVSRGMTVRDIERIARGQRVANGTKKTASQEERRNQLAAREVAKELEAALSIPVEIAHKGPGGKLTLKYRSLDELDRIVALLKASGG